MASNFDARNEYTFTYTYLGAEQTRGSQLSIREDKLNSSPVYEKDQNSLDKNHILPSGTLRNGTAYLAKIRVKTDSKENNGYSDWSPEISFSCYTTPKIIFDTIDQKQFIYTDDVLMSALYIQEQNDPVSTFQFTLYDQRHVIVQSFAQRVPDGSSPTRFSERMSNLQKGKLYYVGLKVRTKHDIVYEQLQEFTAQYLTPSINGVVHPSMNTDEGQISIELFLKQLLGTSAKAYIPNRKSTNQNYYTYWKDDYVIVPKNNPLMYTKLAMAKASDWIAKVWVMDVQEGLFMDFAPRNGEGQHIQFYKEQDYIRCVKKFDHITSSTRSNVIPGLGLKPFYLYIYVHEYRVEMKIVVDQTFRGDDGDDGAKSQEELAQYTSITSQTQAQIDSANQKITAAYNRLKATHDARWQNYINQVNQAIIDARSGNFSHNKMRDRISEIDSAYWDYFNNFEVKQFAQAMEKARRDAEGDLAIEREGFLTGVRRILNYIKDGTYGLEDGRVRLNEYSTAYSFILNDIPDWNDGKITELTNIYNAYLDKYPDLKDKYKL